MKKGQVWRLASLGLIAIGGIGCGQGLLAPTVTIESTKDIASTKQTDTPTETASPTTEITPTLPTPTFVPTATVDPQFITPQLESELPYWLPANPSHSSLPETVADLLGASLPSGAIARIGLGNPTTLALSPDAQFLAVATEAQLVMMRSDTLEIVWAVHMPKEVRGVVWSADGLKLVAWMRKDQRVAFFDSTLGNVMRVLTFPEFPADAAWSPDGSELALVYGADLIGTSSTPSAIMILDGQGHTLRAFPVPNHAPLDIEWSPDGELLALGAYQDTFVLNPKTGDQVLHQEITAGVLRFNSQGTMLAAAPSWFADRDYFAALWDLQTGQYYELLSEQYLTVTSVAWSPDGSQLISGSSSITSSHGELFLWDAFTQQLLHSFSDKPMSILTSAWSPDGSQFVVGGMHTDVMPPSDRRLVVWEPHTWQALLALSLPTEDIRQILWFPDSYSFITSGVYAKHIIRWDAQNGQALHSIQASVSLTDLMWDQYGQTLVRNPSPSIEYAISKLSEPQSVSSPDGALMATELEPESSSFAAKPSTIVITETATGRELVTLSNLGIDVTDITWSPDGSRLAGGGTTTEQNYIQNVFVWNSQSWEMLYTATGDGELILDMEWSPDSKMLAVGGGIDLGSNRITYGNEDNGILVLDGTTGELLHHFIGHNGDIHYLMWSPDGSLLASGSADGTVLIWEVR